MNLSLSATLFGTLPLSRQNNNEKGRTRRVAIHFRTRPFPNRAFRVPFRNCRVIRRPKRGSRTVGHARPSRFSASRRIPFVRGSEGTYPLLPGRSSRYWLVVHASGLMFSKFRTPFVYCHFVDSYVRNFLSGSAFRSERSFQYALSGF